MISLNITTTRVNIIQSVQNIFTSTCASCTPFSSFPHILLPSTEPTITAPKVKHKLYQFVTQHKPEKFKIKNCRNVKKCFRNSLNCSFSYILQSIYYP